MWYAEGMHLFRVLPPLGSVHPTSELAYLPNVTRGSEAWLYHLDQVARFTHWRHSWIDLDSLDLAAPRGSEHGLLVVHPITRTVLGGWDHVHQALAAGRTRIPGYLGEGPSNHWIPQSEQEKLNREAFLRVEALKTAFLKTGPGKAAAIQWKAGKVSRLSSPLPEGEDLWEFLKSSEGVDPNAVGASGRTLLVGVLEACWYGGPAVVLSAAELLRRGALPLRASNSHLPTPGEVRFPLQVAVSLLACAMEQKKYQALLTPLVDQLLSDDQPWAPSRSQALLGDLFKSLPEDQELSPSMDRLRRVWRAALLEQGLPKAAPATTRKPRF